MRARRSTRALVAWSALAVTGLGASLAAPGAALADADGCPNAAIRGLQGAEQVADCRAFELVSPVEKANTDVGPVSAQSATQAGVVVFGAPGAMPGSVTSMSNGFFRAERSVGGWTMRSPDLPQINPTQTVVQSTRMVSRDLSRAFGLSRHALAPGAVEDKGNAYVIDAKTGALQLAATSPASNTEGMFTNLVVPSERRLLATPDMDHVVFPTQDVLLSGAQPGRDNMYEWSDGRLRLVNVLPDGSTTLHNATTGIESNGLPYEHGISDDGSRIIFQDDLGGGFGPLYVRIGGSETKLISHSRRSDDDPTEPKPGRLVGASADGSIVYFSSTSPLTEDAGARTDNRPRLYRYDAATDAVSLLVDLGTSDLGPAVRITYGVSDDGGRVYFTVVGKLGDTVADGVRRLYVWDRGSVKLVTDKVAGQPAEDALPISSWAMSPDGRYVSFTSTVPQIGNDNTSPECHKPRMGSPAQLEGTCREAYAYDVEREALTCLSCPTMGRSAGHAGTGFTGGLLGQTRARAVLADGTFFFDTPTSLVSDDINGRRDVYEWKAGDARPRLMTTGTDPGDAEFSDVSADGTDVYFTTANRLVSTDGDDLRDVYSARRDGGLPGQNAPVVPMTDCVGEACRAPLSGAPAEPGAGSWLVRSRGDVPLAKPVAAVRVSVSARSRVVGTRASLRVRVSGAGTVRVRGASVRAVHRLVAKAAIYAVKVSLTPRAVRVLQRRGAVRTRVTVTFRAKAGRSVSKSMLMTFKRVKGGR